MYVLVFKQEKEEKGNVSKIFFDFLESFFEEGIEKNFLFFLHFFEKKGFDCLSEIRKREKWVSQERKKIFSASRQKK